MKKATISDLKNRLSAYLRRVRAGESVLIFDRDEPVARLTPVEGADDPDDRLTRLERAGLLRRSTAKLPPEVLSSTAPDAQSGVVDALIDERRSGR